MARAAELKPEVTLRLAQIAQLTAKTKSEPPTVSNTPRQLKMSRRTWIVIGEGFLENPNRPPGDDLDFSDVGVSVCKSVLEGRQVQDSDMASLEECARLESVAVIRQTELTRPEVGNNKTFKPGQFRGDVLVFHLATGEIRARYTFAFNQDDKLAEKSLEKREWERLAMSELRTEIKAAVRNRVD